MKCGKCGSEHIHQISVETVESCLDDEKCIDAEIKYDSLFQEYICQVCGEYVDK